MRLKKLSEKAGNWELWPFTLIYAPLGPLWLWLSIKAKAFWWFTPANPTLTFSGFEGEGKREMYELLPQSLYPQTIYVSAQDSFDVVKKWVAEKELRYPLCAKPQVGLKGLLFRKIDSEEKLAIYHQQVPVDYLIQPLIEAPMEVSVFYYRFPHQDKGVISGLIEKEMMHLFGDGKSKLIDLIALHDKAKHRLAEMHVKHEKMLEVVLPAGEKYILTHAANLNRGASFTNLAPLIDEKLLMVFDPLSHRCQWFYGRYDLKCNSIEELKDGRFTILEFNGAGAEPNHVYNAGYSWLAALKVFAHHWHVLYKIGRYNNRNSGIRYWGNREGNEWLAQARAHGRLLEKYDNAIHI